MMNPFRAIGDSLWIGKEIVTGTVDVLTGIFKAGEYGRPMIVELPLRCDERVLPLDVEQAGRQLPRMGRDRVAVLADEQHPVLVVERQHGDRTGVVDDLAGELLVVVAEGVASHVPDGALEDCLPGEELGLLVLVAEWTHQLCAPASVASRS